MTEHNAFEVRLQAAVHGYAGHVSSGLDPAELAHRIATGEPRHHGLASTLGLRWVAVPRLAWVLLMLALLLTAIVGVALVASRPPVDVPQLQRLNVALVPTGIEVLASQRGSYTRVVADGDGILWARDSDGSIVRFDPATGSGKTWTMADDAAFTAGDIAPANGSGVWLVGPRVLRLFDGSSFRTVIEAPAEISLAAEAPDASLWATTPGGGVLHWDGSSWLILDPGRPSTGDVINVIAVDTAGRPWIGWLQFPSPPGGGRVQRYDGSSWTGFDIEDAVPLGSAVWAIAQLPGGDVWVASDAGLARFDGTAWTDATADDGYRGERSVATGPDGTVWAAEGSGALRTVRVMKLDATGWTTYSNSDGLPVGNEGSSGTAWVLPVKGGTYVGTDAGIYGLLDGRWQRAWPTETAPGPPHQRQTLAVSGDEVWVIDWSMIDDGQHAWRQSGGAWTREPLDPARPEDPVTALTLAPDGTLWAAGSDGVAYRRDGRWVIIDPEPATAIAVARNGTVLASSGWTAWTLRHKGAAWVRTAIPGSPLHDADAPFGRGPIGSLALDGSGALWEAVPAGWGDGGLARYDGQSWETLPKVGGAEVGGATILGPTQDGGIWAAIEVPGSNSLSGVWVSRADGTGWERVDLPPDVQTRGDLVLAPDGTLWASGWDSATGRPMEVARLDGQAWTFPYAGADMPIVGVASVAPDGTVFGHAGEGLIRLPNLAP